MKVDRTGSYLATEIDRALSFTAKQDLPQLVIKMRLVHWYDPNKDIWEDFSGYGMETVGYFVLVFNGKKGQETSLSYDQLMKVYGWDGKDFQTLTEMPAPEMFLVRVEDNDPDFADKNPYVVQWIDEKDADPRGGLKKLDTAGVKDLQAKFGALLNKAGKVAPPASAKKCPKSPPKAPPKAPPTPADPVESIASPADEPEAPLTVAQKKAAKKAKSTRVAEANAKLEAEKVSPSPPAPAAPITPAKVADVPLKIKTKQEAYEHVFDMQAEGTTDGQRNDAWNAAIEQIAGPIDPESKTPHAHITAEQWYEIMHETLNGVGAV